MGVTIENRKHAIDLGYGGFFNLRKTIAKCLDEELGELYAELTESHNYAKKGFSSEKEFFENHDEKVLELCTRKQLDEEVVNFLYLSDCDSESVSFKTCRHLWKYIKDYDDDIRYGYLGRKDCAMFKDFKQIVKECAKNRWVMHIW